MEERTDAGQTVQEFHQLFPEHMRNGDIDAVLELYEPGAAFANQKGEVRVGLEARRQELAPARLHEGKLQINLRKIVQAGDIALVHNTKHQSTQPRYIVCNGNKATYLMPISSRNSIRRGNRVSSSTKGITRGCQF